MFDLKIFEEKHRDRTNAWEISTLQIWYFYTLNDYFHYE